MTFGDSATIYTLDNDDDRGAAVACYQQLPPPCHQHGSSWRTRAWIMVLRGLKIGLVAAAILTALHCGAYVPGYYDVCRDAHDAAVDFIELNCGTATEMARLGTFKECEVRFDVRDAETPGQCAWHMWFRSTIGCGRQGCIVMFRNTALNYTLLFVTVIMAVLTASFIISKKQHAIEQWLLMFSSLPTNGSDVAALSSSSTTPLRHRRPSGVQTTRA